MSIGELGEPRDIQEVLRELRIECVGAEHRHGRPGWVQVDCPYCGPGSHSYHLGFSLHTGTAACWRCGGLRPARVLAALANISEQAAALLLKATTHHTQKPKPRHAGKLQLPPGRGPLLESKPHVRYLANRGYDAEELAAVWGLEAIGQAPRLAWRVFIPIQLHGETVSWTTRAIAANADRRYLAAKEAEEALPAKQLLYGEDHAKHAIIICEGPADVWAIGKGAVAVLGLSYSTAQVLRMAQYTVRAICFDNTAQAQRRAAQLANVLAAYPGDTYTVQLDAKDAGEASEYELRELRKAVLE